MPSKRRVNKYSPKGFIDQVPLPPDVYREPVGPKHDLLGLAEVCPNIFGKDCLAEAIPPSLNLIEITLPDPWILHLVD
jgi:hypothetical protein